MLIALVHKHRHTHRHTHTHKQTNNNNKSSNNHVSCLLFHRNIWTANCCCFFQHQYCCVTLLFSSLITVAIETEHRQFLFSLKTVDIGMYFLRFAFMELPTLSDHFSFLLIIIIIIIIIIIKKKISGSVSGFVSVDIILIVVV